MRKAWPGRNAAFPANTVIPLVFEVSLYTHIDYKALTCSVAHIQLPDNSSSNVYEAITFRSFSRVPPHLLRTFVPMRSIQQRIRSFHASPNVGFCGTRLAIFVDNRRGDGVHRSHERARDRGIQRNDQRKRERAGWGPTKVGSRQTRSMCTVSRDDTRCPGPALTERESGVSIRFHFLVIRLTLGCRRLLRPLLPK